MFFGGDCDSIRRVGRLERIQPQDLLEYYFFFVVGSEIILRVVSGIPFAINNKMTLQLPSSNSFAEHLTINKLGKYI